jgi:hypothetical protein
LYPLTLPVKGDILKILPSVAELVTHRLPSGPAVIPPGLDLRMGAEYSVIFPVGEILPISPN